MAPRSLYPHGAAIAHDAFYAPTRARAVHRAADSNDTPNAEPLTPQGRC